MAKRPTIADLAKEAGVSVATVDRVLNARAPVREETKHKVLTAAEDIGYHAASLIAQQISGSRPSMTLGLLLNKERQPFYQSLRSAAIKAASQASGLRVRTKIVFASGQSPKEFADHIDRLSEEVDAIGATVVNHIAVTEAVARCRAADVPCFSLMNDFAQGVRQSYIGLNNLKIGRIAAHMMSVSVPVPGKIAVFVGGYRWHGHELRETGFRSYLREHRPDVSVLDTLINLETRPLTYEATLDLLARHPDLKGLYCAGGGMEGALAAIREVRGAGDISLIVNELTPESRMALADRYVSMVIGTPVDTLCRELVQLAGQYISQDTPQLPGQLFIDPMLYLPESV